MEPQRVEPHRILHRLAVGKAAVGRHQPVSMARCDLDEIAEHAIVADLECRDAGFIAIARLHRRNRPARIARCGAQFVERRIISIGDIAAIAAFRRRRRHQRAAQPIGQCAVASEAGEHGIEQRGLVRRAAQPVVQAHRLSQTIAQLTQIARTAPARHHPAQSTAQIGDRAQGIAQLRAFNRAALPEFHHRQPRLNPRAVEQRSGQVFGEQARSRPGDAAIHRADQAARAPAGGAFEDFEAGPRRFVHRHPGLR